MSIYYYIFSIYLYLICIYLINIKYSFDLKYDINNLKTYYKLLLFRFILYCIIGCLINIFVELIKIE